MRIIVWHMSAQLMHMLRHIDISAPDSMSAAIVHACSHAMHASMQACMTSWSIGIIVSESAIMSVMVFMSMSARSLRFARADGRPGGREAPPCGRCYDRSPAVSMLT
ncbi:hypothetical protein GC092_07545 [Microbacterium sp. JZ37]|nr:hypothetical protein GC092_07545 [Microbacterium sp. JZ37]